MLNNLIFYRWITAQRVVMETGKTFTFDDHAYLLPIYQDTGKKIVVQKCSQVGLSTYAILECIWGCKVFGQNSIFFQPTMTDVSVFSATKIAPLLLNNPFFRGEMTKDEVNSSGVRKIGDGFMYCRGLKTGMSAKSISSDRNVLDEYDEIDNMTIADETTERLLHSKFKYERKLSRPSFPNYGINREYNNSDKRIWVFTCPHCGRQEVDLVADFESHGLDIITKDGPVCKQCNNNIRAAIETGYYKITQPEISDVHGYRVSQLNTSFVDWEFFIRKYKEAQKERIRMKNFMRGIVGIPWVDEVGGVSEAELDACRKDLPEIDKRNIPYFSGIDHKGDVIHGVIGCNDPETNRPRIVEMFVVTEFEDIDKIWNQYNITSAVIDGMPNLHSARKLCRRFPGRVYMHFYNDNMKAKEYAFYSPGDVRKNSKEISQDYTSECNRTEIADEAGFVVKDRENGLILPMNHRHLDEFKSHFMNFIKQEEEDKTGNIVYRYIKTGHDHFRHAFHYFLLCYQRENDYSNPTILII